MLDFEREVLGYSFNNKDLLLEALTHDTYSSLITNRNQFDLEELYPSYEKLEVLGDAVLDAIVNSNLIEYAFQYKINPFEVHHSKSILVCNDTLAKVTVFYGIQKYIISIYSEIYPTVLQRKRFPSPANFNPY